MFEVSDATYHNFMGRYSTRLAEPFADFAGVRPGERVLDVGAGTGALTGELVRRGVLVAAAEPSPAFASSLHARLEDVEVQQAAAEALPWPDETFDAALAQLVVTFMRDARAGIAEMRRVVRPGGTVAVCMWDRFGMEMLAAINRTQRALDPTIPAPESVQNYRTREELEGLFAGPGFGPVSTDLLAVEASYTGFDEFWDALTGGAGPAGVWASSLTGEKREAARAELLRQLDEPAGGFTLVGRAWAVRATRA